MPPKKPKLPADHPQTRPKRKKPASPVSERVRCKSCEKMVSAEPNAVHSCYDAKALREDAPTFRAEPFVSTFAPASTYVAGLTGTPFSRTDEYPAYWVDAPKVPPSVPWTFEGWGITMREWVSRKLTALARWVAP